MYRWWQSLPSETWLVAQCPVRETYLPFQNTWLVHANDGNVEPYCIFDDNILLDGLLRSSIHALIGVVGYRKQMDHSLLALTHA